MWENEIDKDFTTVEPKVKQLAGYRSRVSPDVTRLYNSNGVLLSGQFASVDVNAVDP